MGPYIFVLMYIRINEGRIIDAYRLRGGPKGFSIPYN